MSGVAIEVAAKNGKDFGQALCLVDDQTRRLREQELGIASGALQIDGSLEVDESEIRERETGEGRFADLSGTEERERGRSAQDRDEARSSDSRPQRHG